jgi:hypothetical protein
MAQLPMIFDATTVNPEFGLGQLPVGKHVVSIDSSEIKDTKDGNNKLLEMNLVIHSGQHAGESGAWRLNLFHSNDKTKEIAQKELARLCHATGVMQVQDTSQLHNIQFGVEVALQKGSETMTEVKRVLTAQGEDPAKANYSGPQGGSSGFTQPGAVAPVTQQPVAQPTQPAQPDALDNVLTNAVAETPATPATPAAGGWSANPAATPAATDALPWTK